MTIEHLTPDAQSALTSIARLFLMNTLEVEATDDRVFNVADLLAETLNTAITHAHGLPAYTNSQVIMSALKACDLYIEEEDRPMPVHADRAVTNIVDPRPMTDGNRQIEEWRTGGRAFDM